MIEARWFHFSTVSRSSCITLPEVIGMHIEQSCITVVIGQRFIFQLIVKNNCGRNVTTKQYYGYQRQLNLAIKLCVQWLLVGRERRIINFEIRLSLYYLVKAHNQHNIVSNFIKQKPVLDTLKPRKTDWEVNDLLSTHPLTTTRTHYSCPNTQIDLLLSTSFTSDANNFKTSSWAIRLERTQTVAFFSRLLFNGCRKRRRIGIVEHASTLFHERIQLNCITKLRDRNNFRSILIKAKIV
jgi:hypothetical protein